MNTKKLIFAVVACAAFLASSYAATNSQDQGIEKSKLVVRI